MKNVLRVIAVLACVATMSTGARAVTYSWDQNGAAAGTGGTGAWDTTSSFWNNGGVTAWSDGSANDAVFPNTAGTVTISAGETRTAGFITFSNPAGNYIIAGGDASSKLVLNNTAQSIIMQTNTVVGATNAQIISAPIGGTDITVYSNVSNQNRTLLSLAGANSFTGNLTLGGGALAASPSFANTANQVNINVAAALPSTATVNFARNFSQLLFTAGGAAGTGTYTATFNNNINLNSSGSGTFSSSIGSANNGTVATLSGVISGNADLNFQLGGGGGQGTIVVNNSGNTYSGKTIISTAIQGITRLGLDNGLPTSTGLSFGTAALNVGAFDLAGHDQTVVSLGSNTSGTVNGVINTSATLSTLTINGLAVTNDTAYKGNIGIPTVSAVTGATDNIKLVLASTNTANLTLTNSASTYTGGTKIAGGSIIVNGASLTAPLGTGPVELAGGKLTASVNRTVPLANALNVTANSSITTNSTTATVGFEFSSNSIGGSAGTLTFKNEGANDATDTFRPRFTGSGFTFARPIAIDNGAVGKTVLEFFNPSSTSQTFSGDISGSGAVNRSSSSGAAGETVFSGNNSYGGGTAINNSTLTLTNPTGTSGTGAGSVTLTNSGVLNVGNGGNSGDLSGNITATSGTVNFNRSTDLTYNGAISGTAGVVTKSGANSIVTLGGTNSYGGATTVNGGTLSVNGSITGIGAVTVKNGGTLAGTGSVAGAVTVESGGFVGPGAPPAVLTVGSLSFLAGSTQLYDIDSSLNTNIGADAMKVLGGVTIDTTGVGVALNANDLATPQTQMVLPPGTRFTLMAYNATAGLTGTFAGLSQGNPITIGLTTFTIDYHDLVPGDNFTGQIPTAGSGFNFVTLTAVPEASAVLFGGLICLVVGVAYGGSKLLRRSTETC